MNECLTTPQHINKAAIGCQTNGIEREKAKKKKDKMKNKINILAYKIADNKIFGIHYSYVLQKEKERKQERERERKRQSKKKRKYKKKLKKKD